MDDSVLTIYCLCDDLLKALRHQEDPQRLMSDAEVMTTAIVATLYFGGNFERARLLLASPRYIPGMLSKSQFNRRLHAMRDQLVRVFRVLGDTFKRLNAASLYIIDSFPVAACDNIRIKRDKRFCNERFRGYTASKRRYFYGLRVHLVVTGAGEPVEFSLAAGSEGDISVFKALQLDLPECSIICADKAYTDYYYEVDLTRVGGQTRVSDMNADEGSPHDPGSNTTLPARIQTRSHPSCPVLAKQERCSDSQGAWPLGQLPEELG